MPELLWLLLPVAALSGWVIGRGERRLSRSRPRGNLPEDYFEGLNYLLNEEQDKAIEVFTRMVEVDSDTVETHLTLGNLFRRRGEVDRAIRIHQNLIARPSLDRDKRAYALLELAKDYMRAGLLDRAENLFQEAVAQGEHAESALRHLVDLYQQEKEWGSAIDSAARLERLSGRSLRREMAQFACEQAEEALRGGGGAGEVRSLLKRALSYDPDCVRASVLRGDLERELSQWKTALKSYQRVQSQDVEYLPEVLSRIHDCYIALQQENGFQRYLYDVLNRYDGVSVVMKLSELIAERDGRQAAIEFMATQLRRRPSVRGLNRLIELNIDDNDPDRRRQRDLRVLQQLFTALLADRLPYRCRECGFEGRMLHWQCPSCRSWSSIKPVKGLQGE
jgi:lipopolysaccharide biosynthesis regulator YciM